MNRTGTILIFVFLLSWISYPQKQSYKLRTIAFYNVENLFDTINDPLTIDEEFTPQGRKNYTGKAYRKKLRHIARVLLDIGTKKIKNPPVLIGLAEIENAAVLTDLTGATRLKDYSYQFVHYDSPDKRGIDVALLYRDEFFSPLQSQNHEVRLWDESGRRIYTRDMLWVHGILDDEEVHLIIVHWPSRRGGQRKSRYKREKAAFELNKLVNRIREEFNEPKIIIMGDFNDNPVDKSIRKGLNVSGKARDTAFLYNPMYGMYKKGLGTVAHRDRMYLFDQFMLSRNLLKDAEADRSYFLFKAAVFNPDYLISPEGKYQGYPFRSFGNQGYTGGFSDHFPVYIQLIKKIR